MTCFAVLGSGRWRCANEELCNLKINVMKKLLFSLFAILPVAVFAEPVGQQTAQNVAKEFLASKGKFLLSTSTPYRAPRKGKAQTDASYYYVFNAGDGAGYVIVSGDDRTERVLGYVEHGNFDAEALPESMKGLLQQYAEEIQTLDEQNVQISPEQVQKRVLARRAKRVRHSIPEILPTRWNQGSPYNSSCPDYIKSDGTTGRPASGCVATAIGQVMYHHHYPDATVAAIPALTNSYTLSDGTKKSIVTPSIPKGSVIDWANMLATYGSDATAAEKKAVGDLIWYAGQSVKMGYNSSSGAVTSSFRDAAVNYFGFDKCCRWLSRSSYGIDEWFDLIYTELDNGYPLLYNGHTTGGGHAFVVDGFDGEGLFHLNWGWGGSSNGWFVITSLNPGDSSGTGASSTSDGYCMGNGCLMYLRKPGVDYPVDELRMDISSISVSGTSVSATYKNNTGATNSFNVGLVVLNEENDSIELITGTSSTMSSKASGASETKSLDLRRRLTEGVYKISPASKLLRGKVWHPQYDFGKQYIEATVNKLGLPTLKIVNPVENLVVDTFILSGTRVKGEEQPVKVRIRNEGGEFYKELSLYGGFGKKEKIDSRTMVALKAGETAEFELFFTPDGTGTFSLYLCDNNGTKTYGQTTVEITTTSTTAANLYLSAVAITNSSSGTVYSNRFQGTVSIKNQAKTQFDGKVKIQIWEQGANNSGTYWTSSSKTVAMSIAPAKTSTASFNFENLKYDRNYYLVVYYVGQSGAIENGAMWNNAHKYKPTPGLLYWTSAGVLKCQASKALLTTPTAACGLYMNGTTTTRMTPSRTNPNAIYCIASDTPVPAGLEESNVVVGSEAEKIDIVDGYPYFVPNTFRAKRATYSYTFPEDSGSRWDSFILPFVPDTMYVDSVGYSVQSDSLPFAIYEYGYLSKGVPAFVPTTIMRANTPYIIAGAKELAGKTLVFEGGDALFAKSGTTNFVISSTDYTQYGVTLETTLKEVYTMNDEGTAFVYAASSKVQPLKTYFTTTLPDSVRAEMIPLPAVPVLGDPDAVGVVRTVSAGMQPVYNLQGQMVGRTFVSDRGVSTAGLKPGVYIVGGRKIFVK